MVAWPHAQRKHGSPGAQLRTIISEMRLTASQMDNATGTRELYLAARKLEHGTYILDEAIRIQGTNEAEP